MRNIGSRSDSTTVGMKIQCDACERAEAAVLCCADEAALCWACDEKVHAANKLAGKHQRVPLLPNSSSDGSSSQAPTCDICQEKAGYFFCLEDRALLCRQCDVAIHTASPYVSCHQRFLITGIRVALQQYFTNNSCCTGSNSNGVTTSSTVGDICRISSGALSDSFGSKKMRPLEALRVAIDEEKGYRQQWSWNQVLLENAELEQCYGFSDPGSSC